MTFDGKPLTLTATGPVAWEPGHVAAQSFKSQPGTALEIAEAGDFEKDQPFTAAVWVKLTQETEDGALVARMDDEHGHRGWDIWVDKGKIASHIVNNWDRRRDPGRDQHHDQGRRMESRPADATTARARPPASRSTSTARRSR